jgi:PKD repeat protein
MNKVLSLLKINTTSTILPKHSKHLFPMKKIFIFLIIALLSLNSHAQTYCTPSYSGGTVNGDFISGISVGSIYNMGLNVAGTPSYIDTTSSLSTTLTAGAYYFLQVFTGTRTTHNTIAVFIDYNGDGDFFDADESVIQFPEVNFAFYPTRFNFQVPAYVGNYVSRMRVVEVYDTTGSLLLRPCGSYQFGQTQDFKINFSNTVSYSPCLGTDTLFNCNGFITDGSGPNANYNNNQLCSWLIKSYAGNKIRISNYELNLAAGDYIEVYDGQTNGTPLLGTYYGTTGGTFTSTGQNVFVVFYSNASNTAPGFSLRYNCVDPDYCSPSSSNSCSSSYITNVSILTTGLNNTSTCDSAQHAYSNFPNYAIIETGRNYTLAVTMSSGGGGGLRPHAWIDFNQNSIFEINEYITNDSVIGNPAISYFTVPPWAISGSTKMRVKYANAFGYPPGTACSLYQVAEVEDYGILIKQAASFAPIADFSAAFTTLIAGEENNFNELCTDFPSSWIWSFPGAIPSSSSSPNPKKIVYPAVGCYPVTLYAYNGIGGDTITKTCYINVLAPGTGYCNPNPVFGTGNSFINGVHLNSLNNLNTGSTNGSVYTFYPNPITDVALTINSNLTIYSGPDNSDYYAAWIDYNNDNDFNDANEKLGQVTNVPANSSTILTFAVPSGTTLGNKRMRVRNTHTSNSGSIIDPCTGYFFGETEDYIVNIITAFPPPVAAFTASNTSILANSSVNFTDQTSNAPTSWNWTFSGGSPSTSNVQNPTNILYSTPGCYAVQLIAISANGQDTTTQTCYINVATIPPIAEFSSNVSTLLLNGSVNYTDQSSNDPTSWEWTFYGANPGTSSIQNPSNIAYNSVNCFDVKLKVSNSAGSDSITKSCYINVVSTPAACSELFFSEYLEGASNDKALEIYNPTSAAINLSGYTIEMYANGASTPTATFPMTGSLAAQDVFVLANAGSNATILGLSDVTSSVCNFNGNDALVLKKNGITLDVIGVVGVNPGASWAVGTASTQDYTLRRKFAVSRPKDNWTTSQTEWNSFPIGTSSNLGSNANGCSLSGQPAQAAFSFGQPTCEGLGVILTNTSVNTLSYVWTFSGTTPSTSTLSAPSPTWTSPGVYQITLVASNSIYSDTLIQLITINANPPLPIITQIGNTLESSLGNSYEWYLANNQISGATSQQYTPTQNGQYRVRVFNANGCWTTSLNFNFVLSGETDLFNSSEKIKVMPNPFTDNISVVIDASLQNENYLVLDKLGRVVKPGTFAAQVNSIDMTDLAKGIYFLSVRTKIDTKHFKLIKN